MNPILIQEVYSLFKAGQGGLKPQLPPGLPPITQPNPQGPYNPYQPVSPDGYPPIFGDNPPKSPYEQYQEEEAEKERQQQQQQQAPPPEEPPQAPTGPTPWRPKSGELVWINANTIMNLRGEMATVKRVFAGGKRIEVMTIYEPVNRHPGVTLILKPQDVIPVADNTRPQPEGAPPPMNPRPVPKGETPQTQALKSRWSRYYLYLTTSSVDVITQAIQERRKIRIDQYVDLDGNLTQGREVEAHVIKRPHRTQNELLLSRDFKDRGGDWRCFRTNAMEGVSLVDEYNYNNEEMYAEVDEGVHGRLMTLKQRFPEKNELLEHANKDNLLLSMIDYRELLGMALELDHDVKHKKHKKKKHHKESAEDPVFLPYIKEVYD